MKIQMKGSMATSKGLPHINLHICLGSAYSKFPNIGEIQSCDLLYQLFIFQLQTSKDQLHMTSNILVLRSYNIPKQYTTKAPQ